MAIHADPGQTNGRPVTAKNTSQPVNATACVQATITSGGMSRARPFTTANCPACVTAAASESANQLSEASPGDWRVTVAGRAARQERVE